MTKIYSYQQLLKEYPKDKDYELLLQGNKEFTNDGLYIAIKVFKHFGKICLLCDEVLVCED